MYDSMDGGNILKLEMYNLNAMPTVGTGPHSLPFLSFPLSSSSSIPNLESSQDEFNTHRNSWLHCGVH